MAPPRILPFPRQLQAPGTAGRPYEPVLRADDLPVGTMRRITRGDLDVLLAHTSEGVVATDDRCPHMSAPFTAGRLDGCILHCPLHRGAFDVRNGEAVTFPTTGGLTADGAWRPTWSPESSPPKPPPTDAKAQARALTRVRRLRYYPLRVREGAIEIALPA